MHSPPDDEPCEVTITAPDREWLRDFARSLVNEHLAAAAHLDAMTTIYRWDGVIREGKEARVRLHTTFGSVREISARTRKAHAFSVPAVVATPIVSGNENYLRWIEQLGEFVAEGGSGD